jgi:nicotinate phosphoribosyltransferase
MPILKNETGLYVDLYELTMAQGHYLNGKKDVPAVFEYFFRVIPYGGGFVIFAGLIDLLEMLERYRFDEEDCVYLESIGFRREFITYLSDFRPLLTIYAPHEGEIVFPNEPIVRVEGKIIEAQIVETILLNILNFESLIATKAARIRYAAGDKIVAEFGLRRAQGLAGIHASKAAIIGGIDSTSNVFSAKLFGLKPTGTQAHSWIQAYGDELEAFRQFANVFPERCVLLVDTYNTLQSGLPNAITVAKEMESRGEKLYAIRLDSGDLAYLSKRARSMLDDAGLQYVKILASNQLDEYIIRSLQSQEAPIDGYGVGTRLITGQGEGALDGVYKIAMVNDKPLMKISDNIEKMTLPGRKKVFRYINGEGFFNGDAVVLDSEESIDWMYHPYKPDMSKRMDTMRKEELMRKVMDNGKILIENQSPYEISRYARQRMSMLSDEHKRFEFPHIYKVGISKRLIDLRSKMIREIKYDEE